MRHPRRGREREGAELLPHTDGRRGRVLVWLARSLYVLDRDDDAVAMFHNALRVIGDSDRLAEAEARTGLADALIVLERDEEAVGELRQALALWNGLQRDDGAEYARERLRELGAA